MPKPKKATSPRDTHTEQVEAQLKELTTALQRERADATNIRRRHEEEIANLRNHIKTNIIRELLPVIDNFERALKHVPKELEGDAYIKGIAGIVKQFEKTLADMGIERIKTVGANFDPKYHEAVSTEDGEGEQDIITEELQAGYRLGDNVIRHAMVRVRT
jgi:molecular chaperone GrpE